MLDVSGTQIDDDDLIPLLRDATNLLSLGVNQTPVTDKTLDSIPKNTVTLSTVMLLNTNVTLDGIKRFVARVAPKWVLIDWLSEEKQNELDLYIKQNSIQTGVVAIDKYRMPDMKSKLLGSNKHVRDMTQVNRYSWTFRVDHGDFNVFRVQNDWTDPVTYFVFPAH